MQVRGGPQIDLSAQVAMVRAKTRPWKSIIALVLAIGAAAASGWAHSGFHYFFQATDVVHQIVAAGTAAAFCVFASAATIGLSGRARSVLEPVMGTGHAAVVRYALVLIGAVTTLIVTLMLFGVPVGQLLLGGALTSVFVGIAAQQALSNVFAGLVLLLARPFLVGDAIRMRAGALSGEIGGTVTEIGITYVRLSTGSGVISIPNSQVLNAVVGPLPPGDYPAPPPPAPPQAWPAPLPVPGPAGQDAVAGQGAGAGQSAGAGQNAGAGQGDAAGQGSADGSSAGPVGTADGSGGAPRPGTSGEQ